MDPISGVLTLGTGLITGEMSRQQAEAEAARQREATRNYKNSMTGFTEDYNNTVGNNISQHQIQSQNYLNTPSGVNNWLNPNMDYQMGQIANMNNQQYGSGGKMNSGAAMKSLQDRGQNLAKLSWNDAFNQMNTSNNQGLGYVNNVTGMKNDFAGNMFNAQQGMAANELNAAMGQRTAGIGDFLTGFGSGANAFGNVMNAFRPGESNKTV
jgi:hypothetical protein